MRELRKALRAGKVKFKVARKNFNVDCREKSRFEQIPDEMMGGPIGISFGMEDDIAPSENCSRFRRNCMKK